MAMKFCELIQHSIEMNESANNIRYNGNLIKVITASGHQRSLTHEERNKMLGLNELLFQNVDCKDNEYHISNKTAQSLKMVYPETSLSKNIGIFFGGVAAASLFWGVAWYHYSKK